MLLQAAGEKTAVLTPAHTAHLTMCDRGQTSSASGFHLLNPVHSGPRNPRHGRSLMLCFPLMQASLTDLGWLAAKALREKRTPEANLVRRLVLCQLGWAQHPVSQPNAHLGVAVTTLGRCG